MTDITATLQKLPPTYSIYRRPRQILIVARLACMGRCFSAIVGVVNLDADLRLFDWAVYWGGSRPPVSDEGLAERVSAFGKKLSPKDAAYYFPALPIDRYRA